MINQVFFSPDGALLVQLLDDRVQIWTVAAGRLQTALAGTFVGLSRDGTICLTRREGGTYAWRLPDGREVPLEELTTDQFAYHQRVRLDSSRGSNQFVIHDLLAPDQTRTIALFDDYLESPLQKTPTDRFVLFHGWYDIGIAESTNLICFDIGTGERITSTGNAAAPRLCYSPAHSIIMLITGEERIACCDLPKRSAEIAQNLLLNKSYPALGAGEFTLKISGPERNSRITWASINPQDRLQVAIAVDSGIQVVRIQDSASPHRPNLHSEQQITLPEPIAAIEFHPDGQRIACLFQSGSLALYRAATGDRLMTFDDRS